ncbi:g5935 [Coccomyxa elongata]
MHAIPIFYQQNGTLYIDNTNFPYNCAPDGGFHDFFKYDEHLVPWSAAKEAAAGDRCRRVSFYEIDQLIYNTLKVPFYQLDIIGIQRAWWYRKWVWEWIEKERVMEVHDAEKPTIGFHIRGGDVVHADKAQGRPTTLPGDYIHTFKKAFPHIKGGSCIFAGDQHELLLEAAQIAEAAIGCHAVFGVPFPAPEGYSREAFSAMDQDARCEATLQILGDMEVLARADYFVSSYHSRWSNIVEWMRYGLYNKERSTAVDASSDHADLYSLIHSIFKGTAAGGRSAEVVADVAVELTELELDEEEALHPHKQTKKGPPGKAAKKGAAKSTAAKKGAKHDAVVKPKGSSKAAKPFHTAQAQDPEEEDCVGQSCVGTKVAGGTWVQEEVADMSEPATNAGAGHDGSFKG